MLWQTSCQYSNFISLNQKLHYEGSKVKGYNFYFISIKVIPFYFWTLDLNIATYLSDTAHKSSRDSNAGRDCDGGVNTAEIQRQFQVQPDGTAGGGS